jgi:hypothetical protein
MGIFREVSLAGAAAVTTVTVVHPIDSVKTRLQVSGVGGLPNYAAMGVSGTARAIIANEGVLALWKGVNAAWLREASYTSLRLGLYTPCKAMMGCGGENPTLPFLRQFMAGSIAGGIGSLVGNPFDVIKTRMMTSSGQVLPLLDTAKAVGEQLGWRGYYVGLDSNIARAMVLNGTKMSCYDQFKSAIADSTTLPPSSLALQAFASVGAGFCMTCTVAPFDMVKTRMMSGREQHRNSFACALKIVKSDGLFALWRGALPIWIRFAPTTTIQLVVFEQLKNYF